MTKAEKMLQQRLNVDLQYGIKIIRITGYTVDRGRVFIDTNEKQAHFDYTLDDAPDFLSKLVPVKHNTAVQATEKDSLIATAANADALKAILMDNITKVQADPGYIKQATVINNNVNSIVNITKMQLDYAKAASKMK